MAIFCISCGAALKTKKANQVYCSCRCRPKGYRLDGQRIERVWTQSAETKRKISISLKRRFATTWRKENPRPWNIEGEYPENWSLIARVIRKRDKYKCQLCGRANSHHVHHINEIKTDNYPENLITLCKICHLTRCHRHAHTKWTIEKTTKEWVRLWSRNRNRWISHFRILMWQPEMRILNEAADEELTSLQTKDLQG
ncbi:hypothetical protein LCGC14_0235990 [marine sediment metagenome]|uniref:HNH nuclease domain-containing protein n=1 Tax=marine sediment metagenome TaxID=412755 RepID=A0A0F9XD93_9ZZZZ